MSSNPPEHDSTDENVDPAAPPPVSTDELLPPVEPPDASFILQLFVIPAVIVLGVVLLGFVVTKLASRTERDPQKIVATLRSSSNNRWQEAFELANALRSEELNPGLKNDTQLAGELAKLLDEEITAANEDDGSVKLRSFLCSALGAFHVDTGVESLLRAARDDTDPYVRGSAIDALAVLSDDFRNQEPPKKLEHPDFVATFVELANDKNDEVRSRTAYALGVLTMGQDVDPRLEEELEKLAEDLNSIARYNAALALARRGNMLAMSSLKEMLDLESLVVAVSKEPEPSQQTFKRNTILKNALEAILLMKEKNPEVELSELRAALERFIETAPTWEKLGTVPEPLIQKAREVAAKLS